MANKAKSNENKIKKIGGDLFAAYITFRNTVQFLNVNYVPFFSILGFNSKDKDKLIKAIISDSPIDNIKEIYLDEMKEKIQSGKMTLESIVSARNLEDRDETPEEREKRIHRSLCSRFKELYKEFDHNYKPQPLFFNRKCLEILYGALTLTSSGLIIDTDAFIEIYENYLEVHGSTTYDDHKFAADTINRFFNGSVKITIDEFLRYFSFENGIIVPNKSSINKESYVRLGFKGGRSVKKQ